MLRSLRKFLPLGKSIGGLDGRSVLSKGASKSVDLSMSIASAQYEDEEMLAMTRSAAALVARWGVQDAAAERLLNGEGRAVALLGIHRALRCIFADSDRAARWIGAFNEVFDGACALDLMLADGLAGMRCVEVYFDAEIAS